MLNLSTISLKDLVKDYGPLFTAGAGLVAATVASFAARAAMRSARASEQNVETAKLSMELGNRAYISIESTALASEVTPGVIPCATISFLNTGRTPAKSCRLRRHFQFIESPFEQQIPQAPLDEGVFALAPNERKVFRTSEISPTDPEQMAALYDETLFLYFWGEILYQDVFGKEHHTTWCSHYHPESPTRLTFHAYHNDMT